MMIDSGLSDGDHVILDKDTMKRIAERFFRSIKEELPEEKAHSKNVIMIILKQIEEELDNLPYKL